ncbi:MAG: acyl-CoA desaturase [Deltaproteobacteria bacterium]|nr:acyl-CoA desaturase [Deltaproteobacteria bacterium]
MSAEPIQTETPAVFDTHSQADGQWNELDWVPTTVYWGIHVLALGVLLVGPSATDLMLLAGAFWVRLFFITGGYHRYFSHKSYKTSRAFQFFLAFMGTTCVQKGPLWWASMHRHHHRFSDQPEDVHSPRQKGFWYAHQGWIEDPAWQATRLEYIPDFGKYPELQFLNKWHVLGPAALITLCVAVGGFSGFLWGFCLATTMLWHSTYTINSLSHRWGSARYDTGDDSRNNGFLALLTLGEGWHNNHHRYQASARNGFYWWEVDITYYVLLGLEKFGLVWALRKPPEAVLAEGRGVLPERTAA